MAALTEKEFEALCASPFQRLPSDAEPPFDFTNYWDAIPGDDFRGHECCGDVTYVWVDAAQRYQFVHFDSEDRNVFMVLVLDVAQCRVVGHHLLDLNALYGISSAAARTGVQ